LELGLSRVCQQYFGKPLDKAEQCSRWRVRPLSLEQRTYAALDAYTCALLYEKIVPPPSSAG
jgi:ribonuclease D